MIKKIRANVIILLLVMLLLPVNVFARGPTEGMWVVYLVFYLLGIIGFIIGFFLIYTIIKLILKGKKKTAFILFFISISICGFFFQNSIKNSIRDSFYTNKLNKTLDLVTISKYKIDKIYSNNIFIGYNLNIKLDNYDKLKELKVYPRYERYFKKAPIISLKSDYFYIAERPEFISKDMNYKLIIKGLVKGEKSYCNELLIALYHQNGELYFNNSNNLTYSIDGKIYSLQDLRYKEKKSFVELLKSSKNTIEDIKVEGNNLIIDFALDGYKYDWNKIKMEFDKKEYSKTLMGIKNCTKRDGSLDWKLPVPEDLISKNVIKINKVENIKILKTETQSLTLLGDYEQLIINPGSCNTIKKNDKTIEIMMYGTNDFSVSEINFNKHIYPIGRYILEIKNGDFRKKCLDIEGDGIEDLIFKIDFQKFLKDTGKQYNRFNIDMNFFIKNGFHYIIKGEYYLYPRK